MTVTALTEFVAFYRSYDPNVQQPCRVLIKHIPASADKVKKYYHRKVAEREPSNVSWIRIDSLTASTYSSSYGADVLTYTAKKSGTSRMRVTKLAKACFPSKANATTYALKRLWARLGTAG